MTRLTWLSALWLLAATAFAQQREIRNPHTTAADVAAGAKIFRGHCAECHGLKGEGGRGPSLTTGVFYHGSTDEDLLNNITDGIPGTSMPGVFFSSDQVWQLVSYVRSLSASKAAPPHGDAARGERIFREKGCQGCHLVRGEGGVNGPDLTLIGSQRSPEHLRRALSVYVIAARHKFVQTLIEVLDLQSAFKNHRRCLFVQFSVMRTLGEVHDKVLERRIRWRMGKFEFYLRCNRLEAVPARLNHLFRLSFQSPHTAHDLG